MFRFRGERCKIERIPSSQTIDHSHSPNTGNYLPIVTTVFSDARHSKGLDRGFGVESRPIISRSEQRHTARNWSIFEIYCTGHEITFDSHTGLDESKHYHDVVACR